MWVPVAVWQPCELLYTCYLLTYNKWRISLHVHRRQLERKCCEKARCAGDHTHVARSHDTTSTIALNWRWDGTTCTTCEMHEHCLLTAMQCTHAPSCRRRGRALELGSLTHEFVPILLPTFRAVLTYGHTGHLPRAPGFSSFWVTPTRCGEVNFLN